MMEHKEAYFLHRDDMESVDVFAEGIKESIIKAVNRIEEPSCIGRNKAVLSTLKIECDYRPDMGVVEVDVSVCSSTEPLSYKELMKNYIEGRSLLNKTTP